MFSHDGDQRPTIEQLKAHPWMTHQIDHKQIRSEIIENLNSIRSEKTSASSTNDQEVSRGFSGQMTNLIRKCESESNLINYAFNDKTDFETYHDPGQILQKL